MRTESTDWPAVTFEKRTWVSRLSPADLTRAQQERVREPYLAALTPTIARRSAQVPVELAPEAEDAVQALTRFDAEVGNGRLPFASILLRTESAASSEIENLTSGARAIAEAELGERTTGNAADIVRNVRTMQAALALAENLTAESIIAMQAALLRHVPGMTGGWRDEQVWIGGDSLSPHRASFIAPHHERVADAMEDLVPFMARLDIPVVTHVALAHAQFETIHPFPDGNGRTGRAIVQAMLRYFGVTRNVAVPVSAGLLHDVDGYYAALEAYRRGDIRPIIGAFTKAFGYAVVNGRALVRDIQDIRDTWQQQLSGLRSDAAARRVADLALEHPAINYALVARELSIAPTTAFRALDTLVERKVLEPATSQQRNRIWLARPVLGALDEFAARAGRRRRPSA